MNNKYLCHNISFEIKLFNNQVRDTNNDNVKSVSLWYKGLNITMYINVYKDALRVNDDKSQILSIKPSSFYLGSIYQNSKKLTTLEVSGVDLINKIMDAELLEYEKQYNSKLVADVKDKHDARKALKLSSITGK